MSRLEEVALVAPPRGFVVAGRFISSWTSLGSLDG